MPGVIGGGQGREGGANGADVEYNVEYKVEAIVFVNSVYIWMDGCMGGSWFHLMSCYWSFIGFDLLSFMVQFLLGSEIIFQIISRFGLA